MKTTLTLSVNELRKLVQDAIERQFPGKMAVGVAFIAREARSYHDQPLGFCELTSCEIELHDKETP